MSDLVIVGTTAGTCACCAGAPPACGSCALDIAPIATGTAAFSNYATALQYLDGTQAKADCYGWVLDAPSSVIFTANVSTDDQIILSAAFTRVIGPGVFNSCTQYAGIAVAAGCVLTVGWLFDTWSGSNSKIVVYTCTGVVVKTFTVTGSTGSHSFSSLSAGQYILACEAEGSNGTDFFSAVFTANSSNAMVAIRVIAKYVDTPVSWEKQACPRTLIPFLAEGGNFYANKSDANAAISSAHVSNCVGFYGNDYITSGGTFTATDGGATLHLQLSVSQYVVGNMMGSINAIKGQTISVNYSVTATSGSIAANRLISIEIRDQRGTPVDSFYFDNYTLPHSGIYTTIALPHTGKYIVWYVGGSSTSLSGPSPPTSSECTISSSGVMTVNQVTALYARSIACPGHVDC